MESRLESAGLDGRSPQLNLIWTVWWFLSILMVFITGNKRTVTAHIIIFVQVSSNYNSRQNAISIFYLNFCYSTTVFQLSLFPITKWLIDVI